MYETMDVETMLCDITQVWLIYLSVADERAGHEGEKTWAGLRLVDNRLVYEGSMNVADSARKFFDEVIAVIPDSFYEKLR